MNEKIIDFEGMKAVVTIPGWAQAWNEMQTHTRAAQRYKRSPTAFTCVQMRAQALSAIPFGIFTDGDIERPQENHPAQLLLDEVNPEMNWVDLIRATESDMLVFGEAFWWKLGNNPMKPDYLLRLNPDQIKVEVVDGELWIYDKVSKKIYPREEIVYFHDYNPDNEYQPLSPLSVCANAIEVEIESAKYMNAFFTNYAVPPVILTTEQAVQDQDMNRLRRWWQKTFRGASNQHKVGIMDRGLKPTILGYPLKDLAMTEVRAEARRDICAALRVPPALAGAWEAANYATATEQKESFYNETIIPRAEYLAGVINAELLAGYGQSIEFVWLYRELTVMQDDKNLESERIAQLVRDGVITPLAGALELGFEPEQAGIGPIQTRIVDEDADVDAEVSSRRSKMDIALDKWERKACNALAKGREAQVTFESDYIPDAVNDFIFERLDGCGTKAHVQDLFANFQMKE